MASNQDSNEVLQRLVAHLSGTNRITQSIAPCVAYLQSTDYVYPRFDEEFKKREVLFFDEKEGDVGADDAAALDIEESRACSKRVAESIDYESEPSFATDIFAAVAVRLEDVLDYVHSSKAKACVGARGRDLITALHRRQVTPDVLRAMSAYTNRNLIAYSPIQELMYAVADKSDAAPVLFVRCIEDDEHVVVVRTTMSRAKRTIVSDGALDAGFCADVMSAKELKAIAEEKGVPSAKKNKSELIEALVLMSINARQS